MLSKVSEFLKKNVGPGKMLMWNWLVIIVVIIIIIIIVIVITSSSTTTTEPIQTEPVQTDSDVRIYTYDNANVKYYLSFDSSTLALTYQLNNAKKFQIVSTDALPLTIITGSWDKHFYIKSGTSKLTFAAGRGTCNISMSSDESDGNVLFFRTIDMIDPVPTGTILKFNSPIGISPALTTVACYGQALAVTGTSVFYSVNSAAASSANITWYFEPV